MQQTSVFELNDRMNNRLVTIGPEDTLESVKEKGLKLEWELYPECIQIFAENKI